MVLGVRRVLQVHDIFEVYFIKEEGKMNEASLYKMSSCWYSVWRKNAALAAVTALSVISLHQKNDFLLLCL